MTTPARRGALLTLIASGLAGCTAVLGLDDDRPADDAICDPVDTTCAHPPSDCRARVDAAPVSVVAAVASADCPSRTGCQELIECLAQAGLPMCTPLLSPCERDEECCSSVLGDEGARCVNPGDTPGRCTRHCKTAADCAGGRCLGGDVALGECVP